MSMNPATPLPTAVATTAALLNGGPSLLELVPIWVVAVLLLATEAGDGDGEGGQSTFRGEPQRAALPRYATGPCDWKYESDGTDPESSLLRKSIGTLRRLASDGGMEPDKRLLERLSGVCENHHHQHPISVSAAHHGGIHCDFHYIATIEL